MRVLRYLWASPNTAIGLILACIALISGGRIRFVDGALEACGGAVAWLLRHAVPLEHGARAITFGHVILGRDQHALDATRFHEHVHVRQYERWGPAFLPAYGYWSLIIHLRGGDAYRDNPFEQQAFDETAAHRRHNADPRCFPYTRIATTVYNHDMDQDQRQAELDAQGRVEDEEHFAEDVEETHFSDPADVAGRSRLWLPVVLALVLFLITAAAYMLFSTLGYDAAGPETPGTESAPIQSDTP